MLTIPQRSCLKLLERAEAGAEDVVITRAGKPVVRLVMRLNPHLGRYAPRTWQREGPHVDRRQLR